MRLLPPSIPSSIRDGDDLGLAVGTVGESRYVIIVVGFRRSRRSRPRSFPPKSKVFRRAAFLGCCIAN